MSRIAADNGALANADAQPSPVRTGFDPMRQITHNEACAFKASNALHRGNWPWCGSGGAFSEPGTTRHAVKIVGQS